MTTDTLFELLNKNGIPLYFKNDGGNYTNLFDPNYEGNFNADSEVPHFAMCGACGACACACSGLHKFFRPERVE